MIGRFFLPAALLLASCSQQGNPQIELGNAWARATSPGQTTGAIYVDIENKGGAGDRLIGANTDRAAMAMIYRNENVDGIDRMRAIGDLDVPAGSQVQLKPGGMHIMLEGLKAPLSAGDRFDVSLRFEKGGPKVVEVQVVAPGAR